MNQWGRQLLIKTAIVASKALGSESVWKWTHRQSAGFPSLCLSPLGAFLHFLSIASVWLFFCLWHLFWRLIWTLWLANCLVYLVDSRPLIARLNTTPFWTEMLGFASKQCSLTWSAHWIRNKDLPKTTDEFSASPSTAIGGIKNPLNFQRTRTFTSESLGVWQRARGCLIHRAQNKGPNELSGQCQA